MSAQKNTTMFNWILTAVICLILAVSVILCVVAVTSSQSDEQSQTTATPNRKPAEDNEDDFDPNNVVVREDPTVMTVDLLPVKYSEFSYFYYISAIEVLQKAEAPEDIIANGVEGTPFKTVIYNMAKEYAAKYVLYRQAYESQNYEVDETYAMYLQSNYMKAADKEELDEMNAQLLYRYGVVRNEYISILLYNDAIASYRSVLATKANYSDKELEEFYKEKTELFRKKEIRVIMLSKKDMALAEQLKNKIENGQDMTGLVKEYSVSTTKGSDNGLWTGNIEEFDSKEIQQFLKTATLGEVAVITEASGIYIIRYENDGSFQKRKEDVSAYKAIYDFDMTLLQKIRNEEVTVTVEESLLENLELPAVIKEFIKEKDNTES